MLMEALKKKTFPKLVLRRLYENVFLNEMIFEKTLMQFIEFKIVTLTQL